MFKSQKHNQQLLFEYLLDPMYGQLLLFRGYLDGICDIHYIVVCCYDV